MTEMTEMTKLSNLQNESRFVKKRKRVGRGVGSGRGKTSGRGHKGQKSRAGYKKRYGNEGGQMKLFRKLPCRGFTRGRFAKDEIFAINLSKLEKLFSDGEVVNFSTLCSKGLLSEKKPVKIKILSSGDITKKISIEANSFSKGALEKLEKAKIAYKNL